MKKLLIFSVGLMILISLLGCSPKNSQSDGDLIYTQAAETVQAQLTSAAALIPTATFTNTPEPTLPPTETAIPSLTPTPTIAATATWVFNPAGSVIAPILIYPRIADSAEDDANYQWESNLNVTKAQFEQEMAALYAGGYTPIPVSLIIEAVWNGAELPPRPVAITFDGGAIGVYNFAYPIMEKYGFVGTVFIASTHVDGSWMLSTSQLKELIGKGWEVGSKGYNAVNLVDNYEALADEISYSRTDLEEKLDTSVTTFSYPFGVADTGVISRVSQWGYKGAVGVFNTSEHSMATIYYMGRYQVTRDTTIEQFISFLPWQPETIPTIVPTTSPVTATPDAAAAVPQPTATQ